FFYTTFLFIHYLRPSRYGTDGFNGPTFAHHGIVHVSFHGDDPLPIPLIHEAAMGNPLFGSDVNAEYVTCLRLLVPQSRRIRPNDLLRWKKRCCPRIPRLGISGLAIAPAYECCAPLITFAQAAVLQVLPYPRAIIVTDRFLHAGLSTVNGRQTNTHYFRHWLQRQVPNHHSNATSATSNPQQSDSKSNRKYPNGFHGFNTLKDDRKSPRSKPARRLKNTHTSQAAMSQKNPTARAASINRLSTPMSGTAAVPSSHQRSGPR